VSNFKSFPSWPQYEPDEIEAVQRVLRSGKVNYWTGEENQAFQEAFAQYHGLSYAITVANGTLALELALHAIQLSSVDEVIVPARSFLASASSVMMRGGRAVFADVDLISQNITAQTIEPLITDQTKAIIVVHLAGHPCDMDPIMDLAKRHGLVVIEDCAQAPGAMYKGQIVGQIGDIGVFSFCQDKIISTGGEGGMLITDNESYWSRAWSYKDHGKNFKKMHKSNPGNGFRWVHDYLGSNYRMTEMQAAIGRLQLTKLDSWLKKRNENARILNEVFSPYDFVRLYEPSESIQNAYYKYALSIDSECLKNWDRDSFQAQLNAKGIPCFSGSCPEIYREKVFQDSQYAPLDDLENAHRLGKESLMFLVHPTLTTKDMYHQADVIATQLHQLNGSN